MPGREGFLAEALASIAAQTYRPLEVVVVEDGGEQTAATVGAFDRHAGLTVRHQALPKLGRCRTANHALSLARGEFLGFLDDDDLLLPTHVEALVARLQAERGLAGVYGLALEVPTLVHGLTPLAYSERPERASAGIPFSVARLWRFNYLPIQAVLFRRALYERHGGFCEELDALEDWDLWLRYTAEADFAMVDGLTSRFRVPADRATLSARSKGHARHLPLLRRRQASLLASYRGSPGFGRLIAGDPIHRLRCQAAALTGRY